MEVQASTISADVKIVRLQNDRIKQFGFLVAVVAAGLLLLLFSPEKSSGELSVYADMETNLLVPQKNVVIATVDLREANLDLFSRETLTLLRDFSAELARIPEATRVDSLLDAQVVRSEGEDIIVSSIIPADISRLDKRDLAALRSQIDEFPELMPYINADQDTLLFYLYFSNDALPAAIETELARLQLQREESLPFDYTGRAPILAKTEQLLTKDILVFLPILLLLVLLVFLSFRNLKAIVLAWSFILIAVSVAYSLIRFLGVENSPLILLIPVFSLGLLSDYIIHYFYHLFYEPAVSDKPSVRRRLLFPLSLTAISTLTGFLSLLFINGSGHVQLGSLISVSVVLTFLMVFLTLPYWRFTAPTKPLLPRFRGFQLRLFTGISAHRRLIFLLVGVMVIWGLIQLPKLQIEPYPIEQLPERITIKQADELINREFYGTVPYFLELDTGTKNGILSKECIETLDTIHRGLEANPSVGYAYSLLTVMKRMNYYFQGSEESLLTSSEFDDIFPMLIEQYLLYYSSSVDPLEYESLLDASYRFLSVKGLVYYRSVTDLNAFNQAIESLRGSLPAGWEITVHGMISELEQEKNLLKNNWIFSFLIGSFLIFVTVLFFYRKLKLAVLSLVPGFISMIFSFAIISSASISIDAFSIIFVAIITGLVIDYSIHTLAAIESMSESGESEQGFAFIISYSGIPIFLSFLTSFFSFSVLFLSSFKGARSLGMLLVSSLLVSFFLSLYLLPLIILPGTRKKEIIS